MGYNHKIPELALSLVENDQELNETLVKVLIEQLNKYAEEYVLLLRLGKNVTEPRAIGYVHYEAVKSYLFIQAINPSGYPKFRIGRCNSDLEFTCDESELTHFGIKYGDEELAFGYAIPDSPDGENVATVIKRKSKT